MKNNAYMLEFDGSTTIRKASVKVDSLVRYPFQLQDFDRIESSDNKTYLSDVARYVTNVRRTNHLKSGSRNLDFHLANHRGQSIRVTLWGSLRDVLIEKKPNRLCCQSSELLTSVDLYQPRAGTLENLLMWAQNRKNDVYYFPPNLFWIYHSSITPNLQRLSLQYITFYCKVTIDGIKTRKGWNFHSCGSDTCKKALTRQDGQFFCQSCNKTVDYPVLRYRLKVDMSDNTAQAIVVMFNETATALVNCSEDSLMDKVDEILPSEGIYDSVGSSNLDDYADNQPWKMKRIVPGSIYCHSVQTCRGKKKVKDRIGPKTDPDRTVPFRSDPRSDVLDQIGLDALATISLMYSKDFNTSARYPNTSNSAINLRSLVIDTLMVEQSLRDNSIKDSSESRAQLNTTFILSSSRDELATSLNLSSSSADRPSILTFANMLNKSIFLTSNTNIGQDGKIHSYCGLRLADIPASGVGTSSASKYAHTRVSRRPKGVLIVYHNLGPPSHQYSMCNATMWYNEKSEKSRKANEIKNRMSAFMTKETPKTVDENIVANLIQVLDQTSAMAKSFRMAKEWCRSHGDANFGHRLLSERTATRQYNAPTVSEVWALIINDFRDGLPIRDIVVNKNHTGPQHLYHNLCDDVKRGDTSSAGLGKRIVLPRTYVGSPRNQVTFRTMIMIIIHMSHQVFLVVITVENLMKLPNCSQPEDSNELFQNLFEDLKKLAEYDKTQTRDHPIFLSNADKEHLENPFDNITTSNPKQEPPQDSNIHQLIKECNIKVCEEQKQNMENTMLKLVDICHQKQLLCMHDNVEDIIKSALDSKLLSINSKSQYPDKTDQEVKNVEEKPTERRNHAEKPLQNFRVIHKSSISLKNTSQISSVHAVAPILSSKEPENSLSMGYKHLSITPETESNAKNLLPIPSECEVTSEDKKECDVPVYSSTIDVSDNHYEILFDSNKDNDISSDDESFKDIEYVDASLPDPEIANVKENVVHQEQEEVDLEEISQVQDVVLREKLFSINRLIANIESLKDKPTPVCVFNSSTSIPIFEEFDNSLSDNFSPEFEKNFNHTEETRSDNTTNHATESLLEYDSFCFEIEPNHEKLTNAAMNNISNDSSNDPLLEEVDLFLATDHSIPPVIENFYDPEGDIQPPDDESDLEPEVISAVMENIDELNKDKSFDPRGEIVVSTNDEDVDYFPFMFVIRIFLPYLIHHDISPLFLSAESEDTVFDPGIAD
uniref:Nucleic acid-binding, OB-fold protein n=1 Tax=Tanacetum cinerariifolium TaxID=118510 RepID=A0A6L2J4H0_TANCI|nr:nucleic acid-binding, OB-fold protein [Tanacetum cinerariifolium]